MPLISFVGLPGSGKSTLARRVARDLGWPFLDADREVEREAGCSIATLFEREGELRFRDLEQQVVARLVLESEGVIATGGGAVLREANRESLRDRTTVVYLHYAPEALVHRLRPDGRRPLLAGGDTLVKLRRLFEERDALYREAAHLVLEGERLTPSGVSQILRSRLDLACLPKRPTAEDLQVGPFGRKGA